MADEETEDEDLRDKVPTGDVVPTGTSAHPSKSVPLYSKEKFVKLVGGVYQGNWYDSFSGTCMTDLPLSFIDAGEVESLKRLKKSCASGDYVLKAERV